MGLALGALENRGKLTDVSKNFVQLCRTAALQRFMLTSKRTDVTMQEREDWDAMSYAPYMSVILIAGKDVRIFLKAHFHLKKSIHFLANSFEHEQILDFYREYCNLFAGAIKQAILEQNIVCGISLPTILSGFDELIFSDKVRGNSRYKDCFDLVVGDFKVTITISADLMSETITKSLQGVRTELADAEDIEFL